MNYKTRKETLKVLGIHYHTLYKFAKNGEIDAIMIGKRQLYNVDKYLASKKMTSQMDIVKKDITQTNFAKENTLHHLNNVNDNVNVNVDNNVNVNNNVNDLVIKENIDNKKKNICYYRISDEKQMKELKKQISYFKKSYPNHEIITDIDSELNFNRVGLKKIINLAIKNEINEIITYKDNLATIGYELVENILKEYSNGKIILLNEPKEKKSDNLTDEMIEIMNAYKAKINELHTKKIDVTN